MNARENNDSIDEFLRWEANANIWDVTLFGYPLYAGIRRRIYHSRLKGHSFERQPGGGKKTGSLLQLPRAIGRTLCSLIKKRNGNNLVVVHERSSSPFNDPFLKNELEHMGPFIPAFYNNQSRNASEGVDLDLLRYTCLVVGLPFLIIPALVKMLMNRSDFSAPTLFICGDALYYLMCRHVLRRLGARAVLLTVSYSHYPLVAAAKREGVNMVEYQHGMISRHHIGYASVPALLKPNVIECFDPIWKEHVEALGFRVSCSNQKKPISVKGDCIPSARGARVLVVGQTSIADFLTRKAKLLERRYDTVRYRPHPSERTIKSDIQVCEDLELPFSECVEHYDVFAGVYSTALYEAWLAGKHVLILDHPLNKFFDVLKGQPGVSYEAHI